VGSTRKPYTGPRNLDRYNSVNIFDGVRSVQNELRKKPSKMQVKITILVGEGKLMTINFSVIIDRTYAAILSRSRAGNGVWGFLRMRWRLN
jgi:hypothetical protein